MARDKDHPLKILAKTLSCCLMATVALLVTALFMMRNSEGRSAPKTSQAPVKPLLVGTSVAERGSICRWIPAEGIARSVKREVLRFEISGKVVFIGHDEEGRPLKEGSRVKGPKAGERHGQLLARIDPRDQEQAMKQSRSLKEQASSAVAISEADLVQALNQLKHDKIHYERLKSLYLSGAGTKADLDEAKAGYLNAKTALRAAEARLEGARMQLDHTEAQVGRSRIDLERTAIFAPFDGVIAYMNLSLGEYHSPQLVDAGNGEMESDRAPLVIIDPSATEVTLDIPAFDGLLVREGQSCEFRPLGLGSPNETPDGFCRIEGLVYSVSPSISTGKRTVRIKVRSRGCSDCIRDGLLVSVRIAVAEKPEAILVTPNALLFSNNQPYLFVVEETGLVCRRDVVLGIQEAEKVEIIDGLIPGEVVVTEGRRRVFSGTKVKTDQALKGTERS